MEIKVKVLSVYGLRGAFSNMEAKAKSLLESGKEIEVVIRELKSKRSVEQNAKLHALCADIAAQKKWAGRMLSTEDWKRLLVDLYSREEQIVHSIVPSLDFSGVVTLGEQTRNMGVEKMSDLIEFIIAWAAEQGVDIWE